MAESINLFVDVAIFLYIGVRAWYICLWLIVVEVAHEVMHCIVGEELFELAIQLGRQCFVVTEY